MTVQRGPFFGALPTTGIWTTCGLSGFQFGFVLLSSMLLFVFIDGPVWKELHESHINRILVSYAFIPLTVAAALALNRRLRWSMLLGGTIVLGTIKLVLTALLVAILGLA